MSSSDFSMRSAAGCARDGHAPEVIERGLSAEEFEAVHGGRWFSQLPESVRTAVISRASVQRVPSDARIQQRGDDARNWMGVARGALRLGTISSEGRPFIFDFVGPGQWFGDSALVEGRAEELDVVTHVPSTLVTVSKTHMRELMTQHAVFRDALLQRSN